MRGGSGLLAAAIAVLWIGVHLVTQVLTRPALDVGWTILIGSTLSVLLTLGYPSSLRGPRLRRSGVGRRGDGGRRTEPGRRREPHSPITLMGGQMPLRSGLTAEAAERTVQLLRPLLGGDAAAITDRSRVLAFVGPGADHHRRGSPIVTDATRRVLDGSPAVVVADLGTDGCPQPGCPLRTATIAPLAIGERVVGALKVYRTDETAPPREFVQGMAAILSLHLELAELDRERQLASDAKLDALRAQINPHFLFNALNTIASKARDDPEEARALLLRLADFFRYSIRQHGQFADFNLEYFFVRTYLSLEQARYGDRLRVRYDVDPQVLGVQVPVLVIQPIVENAVKHGLAGVVGGGTVTLRARVEPLARATTISVRDDGAGIDTELLERIRHGDPRTEDGGIGLHNISARLSALFGDRYAMDVRSRPGDGTTVALRIPLR